MIFMRFQAVLLAKRCKPCKQAAVYRFLLFECVFERVFEGVPINSLSTEPLYPEIEPFFTQMLEVSARHTLYIERSGRKGGHPIFFLHGGPGSHTKAAHRRYFDPDFFDIVLFDQRACGRSIPAGETEDNNTGLLVNDINTIRAALGISGRISLFGGSWGSTLALAYAMHHPQRVEELILRGIFIGTDEELSWYTQGLSRFAPEAWEKFSSGRGEDLLSSYYNAVHNKSLELAGDAARCWLDYESAVMRVGSDLQAHNNPCSQPSTMINRARVQLHFLKHGCFLAHTPLLDAAPDIHLPVTIVQGALDLVCPPITAWRLSRLLPQARLRLVHNAGHGALTGNMAQALREEADGLRDRLKEADRV